MNSTNKKIVTLFTIFGIMLLGAPIESASKEVVSLIREDCTGYTKCYNSLKAWEDAFGGINFNETSNTCTTGDLTCLEKSAIARIEGGWKNPDTSSFTISGWTTSNKYFIRIYTAPESRHKGVWDNTKYRLDISKGDGILVKNRNVHIEGLQIQLDSSEADSAGIRMDVSALSDIRVSSSIIKAKSSLGRDLSGIAASTNSGTGATYTLRNNIIYDFSGSNSSGIKTYHGVWRIYNNTLYNNSTGIYAAFGANEEILVKNNLAQKSIDGFFGVFHADSQNNISDIVSDAPGANSKNSTSAKFVSAESGNFHLSGNDTQAKDAGANLSGDGLFPFTDDIDGETRGETWDVGADETYLEPTPETQQPSDAEPPEISQGAPQGTLNSGVREVTISVRTHENAECKYSTIPDIAYASMLETFTTTGGRAHTSTIGSISDGKNYTYYVKCKDAAGNINDKEYLIAFSIGTATPGTEPKKEETPASVQDTDADGIPDSEEYFYGTDSTKSDTDGDGISDYDEVKNMTDPLNPGTKISASAAFLSRVRGRILLQVERRGEAWYIHPVSGKRYFLRDGSAAYEIMRKLGLGITNADLAKIPEAGTGQRGVSSVVNRLKGRILLQVEERGEAWYVNPADGKRYYLKDGTEAYSFMRNLGTGVKTQDLIQIPYVRLK